MPQRHEIVLAHFPENEIRANIISLAVCMRERLHIPRIINDARLVVSALFVCEIKDQ